MHSSPSPPTLFCKQVVESANEVTLFLDEAVCVSVVHPFQVVCWLSSTGARDSSCIRHLVIRFTSLLLKYNKEKYVKDRMSGMQPCSLDPSFSR